MLAHHKRLNSYAPKSAIVFLGDSHIQSLNTQLITHNALNFGIGGDTSVGLQQRLFVYKNSLKHAKAIIIAIGFNDLRWRSPATINDNIHNIVISLQQITSAPIYVQSLFPVSSFKTQAIQKDIIQTNNLLEGLCKQYNHVYFLNFYASFINSNNTLNTLYDSGDGVHLNAQGYKLWITLFQQQLGSILTNE
jgi:lysophospholipase L1-like esterase